MRRCWMTAWAFRATAEAVALVNPLQVYLPDRADDNASTLPNPAVPA